MIVKCFDSTDIFKQYAIENMLRIGRRIYSQTKKERVNYQFSTYFFLRTHSGYVPHNTPGDFGNASAPAVAATPIMRYNCVFFFTA